MGELRIGEVARRTGLRTSAIRYYEDMKLVAPTHRKGGIRFYDDTAIARLGLIAYAKDAGFTLADIRRLVSGADGVSVSQRWRTLAERKLADLERATERIDTMRAILKRAMRCGCLDLDECAARIAAAKR